MTTPTLILASSSPRRKELLHKITDNFIISVPICDETENGSPEFVAENNAIIKGKNTVGDFIIACDTVVALDGVIYGKPLTESKAFDMLSELNGKTHTVYSGVYIRYFDEEITFIETSDVTMKQLSEADIIAYIKEFKPLDKAGSYGLQDGVTVKSFVGSRDNIIGLPTEKIREILRKFINVKEDSDY